MLNFWDQRYSDEAYVYGKHPNDFFKTELEKLPAGKLLLPCDGEGRNAIFAVINGWQVNAFDSSSEGKRKALLLAEENNVEINYELADAMTIDYQTESFDAIALIYAHFPPSIRQIIHQKLINFLKPDGILLLEAFNPLQLNNSSGGPKDATMLYDESVLNNDFNQLSTQFMSLETVILNEGPFHKGKADVIRYVGKKSR